MIQEFRIKSYDKFKHEPYLLIEFKYYDKKQEELEQMGIKFYKNIEINPLFYCKITKQNTLDIPFYIINIGFKEEIVKVLYHRTFNFIGTKEFKSIKRNTNILEGTSFHIFIGVSAVRTLRLRNNSNVSSTDNERYSRSFSLDIKVHCEDIIKDLDYLEYIGLNFVDYVKEELIPKIKKSNNFEKKLLKTKKHGTDKN